MTALDDAKPSSAEDLDSDVAKIEGRPAPSSRQPLSRDRIVACAVDFLDEHSLAELTMRRLGVALQVEAMALYRHIPSRDELLDAVVDHLVAELDADEDVITEPQYGWQDFLQRLSHGVRRVALRHPHSFPLLASRPPQAPWLRPPLRDLRWVQFLLDGLVNEGFSDEAAVAAYRAFTSFLLGHLLLEVVAQGADVGLLDEDDADASGERLASYPTLQRLQDALSFDESVQEYEESLENLLLRLEQIKVAG